MTIRCITHTPDGQCLGHPETDLGMWPPLCARHLEIFMPLIEAKARVLAQQLAHEILCGRPKPNGPRRQRQPVTPRLRKDAHLNADDERVLDLLRGAA